MKVLITGANGFLGSHLVPLLAKNKNITEIITPSSRTFNLFHNYTELSNQIDRYDPDVVIHCAARCGGIGANRKYPYYFYSDNMRMNLNLIDAILLSSKKIKLSLMINSVCSYPKSISVPMKECDLWNGYPEETNAAYGFAKKMMIVQAKAAFEQFGRKIGNLLFTNLYGEGDDFSIDNSHVISAMIRKVSDAIKNNSNTVTFLGTGNATRDFLHVSDAARAIESYIMSDDPPIDPINIGTGNEISINEIAQNVCRAFNYNGSIIWDTSCPDGQPRRCLDISLAKKYLAFSPMVSIEDGIKRTVNFYKENYA